MQDVVLFYGPFVPSGNPVVHTSIATNIKVFLLKIGQPWTPENLSVKRHRRPQITKLKPRSLIHKIYSLSIHTKSILATSGGGHHFNKLRIYYPLCSTTSNGLLRPVFQKDSTRLLNTILKAAKVSSKLLHIISCSVINWPQLLNTES
jgi:hypothetical protein